ncbi:hypothetical protein ASZ90_014902 [hydrocarbon metagenome]|uniref:Uncharacterized protein n=1 Tax=hydrocarbon metagenome TaxID=938273 RepID=A0A0W8F3K8_9ZZZZ
MEGVVFKHVTDVASVYCHFIASSEGLFVISGTDPSGLKKRSLQGANEYT